MGHNIKAYYRPNNRRNFLKAKAYNKVFLSQFFIDKLGYRHRHQKGLADFPFECLIIHVEREKGDNESPIRAEIGIGSEVIKTTRRLIVICEEVGLLYFWGFDRSSSRRCMLEDTWVYGSVHEVSMIYVTTNKLRVPYEHMERLNCNHNTGEIIDMDRALKEKELHINMVSFSE